jgi:hypothetical protein
MHGHLLGATGGLETAITALALYRRQIPRLHIVSSWMKTAGCSMYSARCGSTTVAGRHQQFLCLWWQQCQPGIASLSALTVCMTKARWRAFFVRGSGSAKGQADASLPSKGCSPSASGMMPWKHSVRTAKYQYIPMNSGIFW